MSAFTKPSRRVLIFGDSNTYGYDPAGGRYDESVRWTCRLQQLLGPDVHIIEEGLCGRTCVFDDPVMPNRRGLDYLSPCMESHGPLDTLVIMLGTNDTKERFCCNANTIARGLGLLIDNALTTPAWKAEPDILVVAPFPIDPGYTTGLHKDSMGRGCDEKSRQLAAEFARIAQQKGCRFADAFALPGMEVHPLDGIHLTANAHAALAQGLAPLLEK